MSEHPAGWYPDPRGRHEYRYWDGSVWTDHVADQGQAATDPVDVVGPAASSRAEVKSEPETVKPEPVTPEPAKPAESSWSRPESKPVAETPAAESSSLWSGEKAAESSSAVDSGSLGASAAAAAASSSSSSAEPEAGSAAAASDSPAAASDSPASDSPAPAAATPAAVAASSSAASSESSASSPGPESVPPGQDTSSRPRATGQSASDALRSATATKSPALAGLLTIVLPGSGHFYLGAGAKAGLAIGLLAATVAAYVIAWFTFTSFIIALVIWVAAAAYGIFDLQGVLKPIREAGAAAASISPQQVGLVLVVGGALLIIGLFLPWYHVSFDVEGGSGFGLGAISQSTNASGFSSTGVIDIVLLIIGAATILLGLAALGLGPLKGQQLPTWLPLAVAGAGVVALVLVAYRLAIDPVDTGGANLGNLNVDLSVGRGPGLLLDGAAALGISAAGLVTLIQSGRTTKSP